MQEKNDFIKTLKEERKTLYKTKLKEFEDEIKDERVKRLGARKVQRKDERRSKFIKVGREPSCHFDGRSGKNRAIPFHMVGERCLGDVKGP